MDIRHINEYDYNLVKDFLLSVKTIKDIDEDVLKNAMIVVDNNDILEKVEETDEPKIFDSTTLADGEKYYSKYLQGGEYKFFEDEQYEYYYPSQKTKVVRVYFPNGATMTAEDALKQGKITMDLLDKYEIEYSKREK